MDKLQAFINSNTNMIKQRTTAWITKRHDYINGSESYNLLNSTQVARNRQIKEKVTGGGGTSFANNAIRWGVFFEQACEKWAQYKFNTKLFATDSYFTAAPFAYSPDGIGVVGDNVVLFEFKAPYSRNPVEGRPSKQYVQQVHHGLAVLPICDYGLLNELVFAIRETQPNEFGGHINFYPCEDVPDDINVCDPREQIDHVIEMVANKELVADFVYNCDANDTTNGCKSGDPTALYSVPFTLIKSVIHHIDRDPDFMAKHLETAQKIINDVEQFREDTDAFAEFTGKPTEAPLLEGDYTIISEQILNT